MIRSIGSINGEKQTLVTGQEKEKFLQTRYFFIEFSRNLKAMTVHCCVNKMLGKWVMRSSDKSDDVNQAFNETLQ